MSETLFLNRQLIAEVQEEGKREPANSVDAVLVGYPDLPSQHPSAKIVYEN